MRTYQEAETKLNGRGRRKIGNNTYLERRTVNQIAVKLHNTDVVTYNSNGDCVLQSGGWRTSTTKDRINSYSPLWIVQRKGVWYLGDALYHDGIVIHADGSHTGKTETKTDVKAHNGQVQKIKKYVNGFITSFLEGKIDKPTKGDCWYCLMKTDDGKTLGEHSHSEHLLTHMEENYFVPSLLVRACDVFPISPIARNMFAFKWGELTPEQKASESEWIKEIAERDMKSSLTKYIKQSLAIAR